MLRISYYLVLLFFLPKEICGSFLRPKYLVEIENGFLCPDNNQLEIPMRKFLIDRLNRTHRALTMDVSFAHPIDKTVEGTITMDRWTNGKWVPMPNVFSYQADPCKTVMDGVLQDAKDVWIEYGKAMGVKHPERCEIPAGNYSLNRHPIDVSSDLPFWTGRFRATAILRRIKSKQKVFCVGALFSFVE